jgi:hypothetical protein
LFVCEAPRRIEPRFKSLAEATLFETGRAKFEYFETGGIKFEYFETGGTKFECYKTGGAKFECYETGGAKCCPVFFKGSTWNRFSR